MAYSLYFSTKPKQCVNHVTITFNSIRTIVSALRNFAQIIESQEEGSN